MRKFSRLLRAFLKSILWAAKARFWNITSIFFSSIANTIPEKSLFSRTQNLNLSLPKMKSKNAFIALLCFTFIFSNCKKDKEELGIMTDCDIQELYVEVLECGDSLYTIRVNFSPVNPSDDIFILHDRNYSVFYRGSIEDLPVTTTRLRTSNSYEYLKVAVLGNDADTCQAEIEFLLEDCDSTIIAVSYTHLTLPTICSV